MKFSIFTPTHAPKHLGRLAKSLERQTCQDFEWVVLGNNGVTKEDVRSGSQKIRYVQGPDTDSIGRLKKVACSHCSGEILVEVDHDDELTPDALEEVGKAFDDKTDFVYSNWATVKNGKPHRWSADHGWEVRRFRYDGTDLTETVAFPSSPASFSKIWYAPNHIRAWNREFYNAILRGHDEDKDVLDDHDLLCRTYIEGTVKHIDKCLYVYHLHADNTCQGDKNQKIQEGTLALHDKYIYPMCERWAASEGLSLIDLCGGFDKPIRYTSVDLRGGDICADLNGPWPFRDGEVGVFRAHDALEHLIDPIHAMKEIYRCLAPNGWLLSSTPSTDGRGAFQDPTHRSFWNINSWFYYTRREQARYIGTPVKFQAVRTKNFFPTDWHRENNVVYVKADLLKFSGRTPGLIEI